jgi:hypothetical protein
MHTSNFLAGVALILVGTLLFLAGPQLIMVPSTQTQVTGLFGSEEILVADVWERSVQLDEGILVNGTVAVISALTNEPSEISMLVMDDANYQKWVAHGNPTYIFQRDLSSGQSFSFTVPRTGTYHFVFDNTISPVKKKVTITADLQRQVVVNLPDERVRYVAYALLGVGFLVTVVGALRKTQVPWA